jgi:hypothetical protein
MKPVSAFSMGVYLMPIKERPCPAGLYMNKVPITASIGITAMEKVWLKSYPQHVPPEVDVHRFPSLKAVLEHSCERFGARLLRVKGLIRMEDSGEIALVQGVQGVFHRPQRFRDWPGDDRRNSLVCIARDVTEDELRATLQDLNKERMAET